MHCKASFTSFMHKFYALCLIATQEMGQKGHLRPGATRSTSKIWNLAMMDDLMQAAIWRHQLYSDGRIKPLVSSGRSRTWACELKALKSSSWISEQTYLKSD